MLRPAAILFIVVHLSTATFSSEFIFFLEDLFGRDVAGKLIRTDIAHGYEGSFGGGNHTATKKTDKKPVVFVHGYTGCANDFVEYKQVDFMKMQGYTDSELYGTTYGEWRGYKEWVNQTGMACKYVKAVRQLIQAVSIFTNSSVDVIGVSMGGAVSRKAIMGGKCVDTGEQLGAPLTRIVDAYVGVIGVQHGAAFCETNTEEACNAFNGMKCNSTFLRDINTRVGYEGRRRYVLESTGDILVGYNACGTHPSEYAGATKIVKLHGFDHTPTYLNSFQIQYLMVDGQI